MMMLMSLFGQLGLVDDDDDDNDDEPIWQTWAI
jgi:hypothetical protein